MRLQGQVAIVTGSSRGVGRAVALALAREGCDIVIAAKTEEAHPRLPGTIHDTAREVRALGRRALPLRCNVREYDDVEKLRNSTIDEFGRIDILVNNAGAIHWAPVAEWPAGKFDLVMGVNVRGAFLCSRAVLPQMRERKHGRIVMMSPPVNVAKVAGKGPYLVSKMGMTLLAHAIAGEEGEHGIAATALWPVTMIESEATRFFQMGSPAEWRTPQILADATVEICCAPAARVSGRALYDEDALRELRGQTDFSTYSVVPGTTPAPVCRQMVE
jgi:citronellol/citronellal dehydrogenase